MSLALLMLAALAVVNPARAHAALPQREVPVISVLAAAAAWLVLVPIGALAGTLVEELQVAASTLRMAAGVVLVLQGGAALVLGSPRADPALSGRAAALVPVAFPVLLTPGMGLLVVAGALDRSAPVALAVLAVALATVPFLAVVVPPPGSPAVSRALDGLGRLTGAALVLAGLGLLLNGVFDI